MQSIFTDLYNIFSPITHYRFQILSKPNGKNVKILSLARNEGDLDLSPKYGQYSISKDTYFGGKLMGPPESIAEQLRSITQDRSKTFKKFIIVLNTNIGDLPYVISVLPEIITKVALDESLLNTLSIKQLIQLLIDIDQQVSQREKPITCYVNINHEQYKNMTKIICSIEANRPRTSKVDLLVKRPLSDRKSMLIAAGRNHLLFTPSEIQKEKGTPQRYLDQDIENYVIKPFLSNSRGCA